MKECIESCNKCRDECEQVLFRHCLEMGGRHLEQGHVRLMADCIEICQTAANFMLRGSDMHQEVCGACADICDACADTCDKIGGAEMDRCAEVCRVCAESCRGMSQMEGLHRSEQSGLGSGIMA
jgi:hypothetical protein